MPDAFPNDTSELQCTTLHSLKIILTTGHCQKPSRRQDKKLIWHDKIANTLQSSSAGAEFLQQRLPLFVDPF